MAVTIAAVTSVTTRTTVIDVAGDPDPDPGAGTTTTTATLARTTIADDTARIAGTIEVETTGAIGGKNGSEKGRCRGRHRQL